MQKKQTNHTNTKVLAGMGLVALAAASAGAIFLYGTDAGKQKRKQIKGWSLRMKADVIDKMGKMKDLSESGYHELIDSVAKKYESMKSIDGLEVASLVQDLKKHWKSIKRELETLQKTPKRKAAQKKS